MTRLQDPAPGSPARGGYTHQPLLLAAVALLVPLAFAACTNHVWEDFYITFRSSRNLAAGHGLVYNVGDRVHTYTSPLGVLFPAACAFIAGPSHDAAALWLFRVVCAGFLGSSLYLLLRRLAGGRLNGAGLFTLVGLLAFDPKLVEFSSDGMETALVVFFLVLLWTEIEAAEIPRWWTIALAVAGLQWSRPDAFILATVVIACHYLIRSDTPDRGPGLRVLAKGLAGGAVIYLPWLLWAWSYYGSPVPNTIIAKSGVLARSGLHDVLTFPLRLLTGNSSLNVLYLPTYEEFGGWPQGIYLVGRILGVGLAFCWVIPGLDVRARRLSLSLCLGAAYTSFIGLMPWYVPPWTVLASLCLALIANQLYAIARQQRSPFLASGMRIGLTLLVAAQGCLLTATAWQMRVRQQIIEDGVREPVGRWLRSQARPGDTVFLEPLGYVGYFSEMRTYDYPGLSSPEVVAAIRSGNKTFAAIVARLAPSWLVLRPHEFREMSAAANQVLSHYAVAGHWNAKPALNKISVLPGRGWCEWDAEFWILRRR